MGIRILFVLIVGFSCFFVKGIMAYEFIETQYGVNFLISPIDYEEKNWKSSGRFAGDAYEGFFRNPYPHCFVWGPYEDFVGKGNILGNFSLEVLLRDKLKLLRVANTERAIPAENPLLFQIDIASNAGQTKHKVIDVRLSDLRFEVRVSSTIPAGVPFQASIDARGAFDKSILLKDVENLKKVELRICNVQKRMLIRVSGAELQFTYQ